MGAPVHLVLPDPSPQRPSPPSPAGSVFSPDSSATSSSLSFSESSSSSFTQSLPPDGDAALIIYNEEEKQQQRKTSAVLEVNVRHKNCSRLKQIAKSTSTEPLRERKAASSRCTKGVSMRKACCRCAGAFAADCAAVCCCPCGVLSLLAFVAIELPSALARKMVTHLQAKLCIKDATSARSSRTGDNAHSIFTPTWSCREPSDGEGEKQAVSVIRFSTQNLLEHFEAEHVGFGCLSQKRE